MDRAAIKELLREVLGPNTTIVDHPKWVGMHCPLAPWTHQGGKDSSPSAGISVKDDGTSIFNCLACGSRGPVPWFLKEMEKYTGESFRTLIRSIEHGEFLGGTLPEWGSKMAHKVKLNYLDKEQYLDLYDPAEGHWYLKERGIGDEAAQRMQLMLDPADSAGDERILFPVFDREHSLHGFTGRAVHNQVEPRIRDYHGLQKANVLLGIHLVQPDDPYVVLVEGLFDYAKMVEYDYPAVAALFAGLTDYQAKLLLDLGKPVVLMYDNDAAGDMATEKAISMLQGKLPLTEVCYPQRKGRDGKVICPKDPGTLTRAEVEKMIAKARIV